MFNLVTRLVSRLKRELRYFGISHRFQSFEFQLPSRNQIEISILIVAAGSVRIPTQEWGAVETIIAETIPEFLENGISVGLLNTDNWFEWQKAKKYSYDVIICHSDTHLRKARKAWPGVQLVAVTHYGFAAQPNMWHPSYRKVFKSIALADRIVCLSPAIFETFSGIIPQEKLIQIGNGSAFRSKPSLRKNGSIVMVGKIEKRKLQYEMWLFAKKHKLNIDFIGPVQDSRVIVAMGKNESLTQYFKGSMNRSELGVELPKYRALVLLSEGEADALVLYEAQFAGLEIITNRSSIGSQNPDLPWIHIIEDFEDLKRLITNISYNPVSPIEISNYADNHYRWHVRLKPLISLIKDLASDEE